MTEGAPTAVPSVRLTERDAQTLGGDWRMRLPAEQGGQRQEGMPVAPIEPQTEVVQGHLGSQPGQEAPQLVGSLGFEAEGALQAADDRLHDLPLAGDPAAFLPRPAVVR